MTDLLISMTDVEALKAAGIHYPATESAWRRCVRRRHVCGLENAYKRSGRRTVVDAFKAVLRNGLSQRAGRPLAEAQPSGFAFGGLAERAPQLQLSDRALVAANLRSEEHTAPTMWICLTRQ